MNVKLITNQNVQLEYETYFRAYKPSLFQHRNSNRNSNINLFMESISEIEICSNYISVYSKKFENCVAPLIDQSSDPELIFKLKSKSFRPFKFNITWFDPNGE